jgi:thioredoxin-related protein
MQHDARSAVLALALALCASACGTPDESSPPPPVETAPPPALAPAPVAPAPAAPPAQAAPEAPSGPPPEVERPFDENANADADIRAALAQAGRSGKRVLLVFGGNWCPWCRRMEHTLRNNPDVARAVEAGYHVVHVESNRNEAIDQRYGRPTQHGVPVFVVLAADGSIVTTQETGSLEQGDRHAPARVLAFLQRFTPTPAP